MKPLSIRDTPWCAGGIAEVASKKPGSTVDIPGNSSNKVGEPREHGQESTDWIWESESWAWDCQQQSPMCQCQVWYYGWLAWKHQQQGWVNWQHAWVHGQHTWVHYQHARVHCYQGWVCWWHIQSLFSRQQKNKICFGNAAGVPGNHSYYLSFDDVYNSCIQCVLSSM
jgi:hypothetical protein